jgi:hypothetical protein
MWFYSQLVLLTYLLNLPMYRITRRSTCELLTTGKEFQQEQPLLRDA